jgi:hypothetical protein
MSYYKNCHYLDIYLWKKNWEPNYKTVIGLDARLAQGTSAALLVNGFS